MPDLRKFPLHLGLGPLVYEQPEFSGMEWYADYGERHKKDGAEGRLVSMHSFSENWNSWEMHPAGEEVVICTKGQITIVQEIDGREIRTTIGPGEYAINPPGVWHTANVDAEAEAVFITAGLGTQNKPRKTG